MKQKPLSVIELQMFDRVLTAFLPVTPHIF